MNYIQAFVRARNPDISCVVVRPRHNERLEVWLCSDTLMLEIEGLAQSDFDNKTYVLSTVSKGLDVLEERLGSSLASES